MLFLLVLVTGLSGLQADQNPQKTILQTTVPEKISSSDVETDPENHITYLITIAENPYFVHLKKQSIIAPTAVVHSYDKNGFQHSQPLSSLERCTYSGYVAGFPNSLATLDICSGLRGTIQFPNVSYGIEPVEAMLRFVHIIYEITNNITEIPVFVKNMGAELNDVSRFQFGSNVTKTTFTKLHPQFLEVDIIVDKKLFDYMGSDTKVVIQNVIRIISLVNTMFTKFKLSVVISSIEIWSMGNKIPLLEKSENLLDDFLDWKKFFKPEHVSYLFLFDEHPASTGDVKPGHLCMMDFDSGVALYPKGLSLESYSVIITQLLSISMGLTYDNPDTCHCMGDVCLMTPKAIYSRGMKDFSTCSLDDYKYLLMSKDLGCLLDVPMERKTRRPPRRICGNGVVELNEQCDCGTLKNCTHKACCDPLSCRLKPNAVCGSGKCCKQDCTIREANILCRKAVDECDFEEFCDGTRPHCMPDTYLRNGEYCDSGGAFCYQGRCRTPDKQCIALLGKGVRAGPTTCYDEMNTRNDRFGNCVLRHCGLAHILCGKLVCTWPYKKIVSAPNMSSVYIHVRNEICVSLYKGGRAFRETVSTYKFPEDRDETFTDDGTICGPDMFCINASCRELRYYLRMDWCNASKDCNGHGFCNNFHHCHCDKGYYPPYCQEKTGEFGSVDDGHAYFVEGRSTVQKHHGFLPKQQLQIIFYISIPAVIIITAIFIKQSQARQLCDQEGSESNRSMTEDTGTNTKLTNNGGSANLATSNVVT